MCKGLWSQCHERELALSPCALLFSASARSSASFTGFESLSCFHFPFLLDSTSLTASLTLASVTATFPLSARIFGLALAFGACTRIAELATRVF